MNTPSSRQGLVLPLRWEWSRTGDEDVRVYGADGVPVFACDVSIAPALVAAANRAPVYEQLLTLVKRYASECAECGGTGQIAEYAPYEEGQRNAEPRFADCHFCADIRAALTAAKSDGSKSGGAGE